jgi:hypothetical protein
MSYQTAGLYWTRRAVVSESRFRNVAYLMGVCFTPMTPPAQLNNAQPALMEYLVLSPQRYIAAAQ